MCLIDLFVKFNVRCGKGLLPVIRLILYFYKKYIFHKIKNHIMPAVSTSVMIGAIVTYLGNKLAKNESVNEFFDDFSTATVNWIKPLFIEEDDTPTRSLEKFSTNPNSESKQTLLKATLESELEDNPDAEQYIREIFEKISQSEEGAKIINTLNVTGDNNITMQGNEGSSITINK